MAYRVHPQWAHGRFAPEVEQLDPAAIVTEAAAARARRKHAHLQRTRS